MTTIQIIYLITGTLAAFFLFWFAKTSFAEKKIKPAVLSIITLFIFALIWFGAYILIYPNISAMLTPVILIMIFSVLFFMPLGRTKTIKIEKNSEKVDERDTMFAREEYTPGAEKYEKYYSMRPENKNIDDKIRRLPRLLAPGGKFYDPVRSGYIASLFEVEEQLITLVDGEVSTEKTENDPVMVSELLKELTLNLGADEAGIAGLNPNYVYSHVGRGPEPWGSEVNNTHKYVIVFTVEMNYEKVEEAPRIGITEETALQYLNAQKISIALAQFIRDLGYPARAHVAGSNYQIMLPPVAHDAGLGEMGRLGYLISPKYGARIRLGAVTTDIPLIPDSPIQFGVQDFCEKCKKCAVNCPSGAIPNDDKTVVRGVEKWMLHIEKCFQYWRIIGTDCGLCMKVCPFSHPDTIIHNILRKGIKNSSFARTISLWGDDLYYGKKVKFPKYRE
ncbi:reductive dehalogenase [candidate division KSB1 bacterium]